MVKEIYFSIFLVILMGMPLVVLGEETQDAPEKEFILSGKVIDVTTGNGIANIPLIIVISSSDGQGDVRMPSSDAEGGFSIKVAQGSSVNILKNPLGSHGYMLDDEWMAKNIIDAMINIEKVTKNMDDLKIKLKVLPTTVLSGKVVNAEGEPVEFARVYVSQGSTPGTTDIEGKFELKNVPADRDYQVLATSADNELVKVESLKKGCTEAVIKLEEKCSIIGHAVADDGKPAANLSLAFTLSLNGSSFVLPGSNETNFMDPNVILSVLMSSIDEMIVTDPNGNFSKFGLCKGATYFASWYCVGEVNSDYKNGSLNFVAIPDKVVEIKNVERFIDNWQEEGNIAISEKTKCGKLSNYCLDNKDNILACDSKDKVIRVINPEDKLLSTWKLDFGPDAIDCKADGTVIVAGGGQAAILDNQGKVLKQASIPGKTASGLGYSDDDIFIAVSGGTSYAVYRMDNKLENQTQIIKNLRGCCGQMDITARDGVVYVAANTLFKVLKYDREGKEIASFGKKGRKGDDTFKGCCEPKNVCFDTDGNLYTAESEHCCIKKFSSDGKFIGPVGNVDGIRGCVRVSVAISRDKSRMYMLDTGRNIIRKFSMPKVATAAE